VGNEVNTADTDALRYLDGNAVELPGGKLEGVSLLSQDDQALGEIDGVLIDPASRQLRYFVVESARLFRRRRYLVPADNPAVFLPDGRTVRVEAPSDSITRERFDSRAVQTFSDDDLLTAMFSQKSQVREFRGEP